VSHFLPPLFAPGFFESSAVHIAVVVGIVAAIVSGLVGTFTVLRGQSFAGESFSDIGTTGGSGAFLIGIGPLWGFLIAGVSAAVVMEGIGIQRVRGRDLATGIVLGAALGLAALFLYLVSTSSSTTGAAVTILFGSAFSTPNSTIPLVLALGAIAVGLIVLLYRPLLISSISPELAAARGIPVRLVGLVYLVAVAMTMALSAISIGTILSATLLVGPAATALQLTRTPGRAILLAAILGASAMLIGIVLAYDSFQWPPAGHGWPISFFVVALILLFYLLAGVWARIRGRSPNQPASRSDNSRAVV
jgi:zinc/manganese transport system permease protein